MAYDDASHTHVYGDVHVLEMSKSTNVQINGLTTLAPITF